MSIITSGLGSTRLISQGYGSLPVTGEAVPAGWYPSQWILDGWYTELWNIEYGLSAPPITAPAPSVTTTSSRLREIIRRMEQYTPPETAHRLKEAIRNAEKQNPTKTVFTVGTAEPGLDNYECRLREIIKQLEKHS